MSIIRLLFVWLRLRLERACSENHLACNRAQLELLQIEVEIGAFDSIYFDRINTQRKHLRRKKVA